jgi:hypothetical protein
MTPHDRGQPTRVRELCRQLKPIIGAQAERIWMAYVAEDETGKTQIQDYLELLAAQHFQGSLEDDGPGLVPPKAHEAAGEYVLGDVAYNGRSLFPFGLRENEWTQHVGVFGRSGAGKTNLGFLLVQQLIAQGKPILIFDWKRNYRDLLELPGFENVAVYTVGRSVAPLSFNPLIPPPETPPQTWIKKLISVIAHAYLLGDGVMFLLQEALNQVYTEAGVYSGTVERWPTFRDVQAALKNRGSSGREAGWLSSALRALASLCFGEMDTLVNQGHCNLQRLLEQPVILELDALTQSDKVFFTQAVLLWIHHFRMTEPTRETFKHAVVIEEAHHILSGERQSFVGGQSVMELTFREIREFGEAMIILDQHPSQISMPALGNTYCTFCFNLKHRTDVSAMSQAMLLQDDEKNILGNLQIGEAVVRLQGRSIKPFLMHVPEFIIHKGSFDDVKVRHHMTRLGLLAARNHPTVRPEKLEGAQAWPTTSLSESGEPSIPSVELAFLQDIFAFPDGGVAERYKRLGLSVRQGQKIKANLAGRGLIQEKIEMVRTGKLRVIRLTDQGRLAIEQLENRPSEAA